LKQSSGKLLDETLTRFSAIDKSTNIMDTNAPVTPRGPNYQAGPVESYVTDDDKAAHSEMQGVTTRQRIAKCKALLSKVQHIRNYRE